MKPLINKFKNLLKSIPLYGWIAGIVLFGLQYGMYRLAAGLSNWTNTVSYAFIPKIPFDDKIPLVPFFVLIYLFSYVFWICGPIAASKTSKQNFINFLFVILISYFVGFFILWFAPTRMNRVDEGLIGYADSNKPFSWLLGIVYGADGGEWAWNLFPSYHCLISLCCFLGVFRQKEIHIGFRIYSFIMVILISMSTVFTKQHYILDIFGGLAIPIIVYVIIYFVNPGKKILEKKAK